MTAHPMHLLSIGLLAALCCPVLSASDTEPLDPPTLLGSWVGK
jgi:hypothetical protein